MSPSTTAWSGWPARHGAALSDDVATTRDAVIASCIGPREDDLCLLILARTGA